MWMWVGGMFTVLSHCCMDPQSFMGQCNPLKAQGAMELQKKGQFFRIFPVHIAILLVRKIHHSTGVGVGFGGTNKHKPTPNSNDSWKHGCHSWESYLRVTSFPQKGRSRCIHMISHTTGFQLNGGEVKI